MPADFAGAEDWLFRLREAGYPDVYDIRVRFYRQLEQVGETELHSGSMTTEEIAEGLADFANGTEK